MPTCYECQKEFYFNELEQITRVLGMRSEINFQKFSRDWSKEFNELVELIKMRWNQKIVPDHSQNETELRKDNQQLTTTLNLKDKELKDLQAEIRALHTQLSEKENSSPYQVKITKLQEELAKTLNLVKSKLARWINLLKN